MLQGHDKVDHLLGATLFEAGGKVGSQRLREVVGLEYSRDTARDGIWVVFDVVTCLLPRSVVRFPGGRLSIVNTADRAEEAYSSLFAPKYPPNPIDIAPAISSANPPYITTLVSPRADKPAVRANGTVRPSERPIIASETSREFDLNDGGLSLPASVLESEISEPADSRSNVFSSSSAAGFSESET